MNIALLTNTFTPHVGGVARSVEAFAKAVAQDVVASEPAKYTATMSKAKRRGRVFVDYLRTTRGATAISAYSARRRLGPVRRFERRTVSG